MLPNNILAKSHLFFRKSKDFTNHFYVFCAIFLKNF